MKAIHCDKCGYSHAEPMPTEEELEMLYQVYFSKEKPDFQKNADEDKEWWDAMYYDRVTLMLAANPEQFSILDIGCGVGGFLKQCENDYLYRYGCDISADAVKASLSAYDIMPPYVVLGTVDSPSIKAHKYSAIHCSEVLEHVRDPFATLKSAYNLLEDGGVICVVVPNDYSLEQLELKATHGEYWVSLPHHLNYFNFESIETLMKKAGFDIFCRTTMYPMETYLKAGFDYTKDPALGRKCHGHRKEFDLSLTSEGRIELYSSLAARGVGRECVIIGVKHEAN
jgi:SAM-dependent methyltransferase